MKTIPLTLVRFGTFYIVKDKIIAVNQQNGITRIHVAGRPTPYQVKETVNEILNKLN